MTLCKIGWAFWQFCCQWEGMGCLPWTWITFLPSKKGGKDQHPEVIKQKPQRDLALGGLTSPSLLCPLPQTNRPWSRKYKAPRCFQRWSTALCLHLGLEQLRPFKSPDPFSYPVLGSGLFQSWISNLNRRFLNSEPMCISPEWTIPSAVLTGYVPESSVSVSPRIRKQWWPQLLTIET